ncbi:MAG: SCO family protein [Gemmatimonadota bacterium]|nr:SCO family protein [Gemmatimonadota bacterium]
MRVPERDPAGTVGGAARGAVRGTDGGGVLGLEPGQRWALLALAAVGLVTAGWWALALWPAPGDPAWLARTRAVCFNAGPDGMPDVSGWMLLIGQPLGMVGFLAIVWPAELAGGLARLAARPAGRGLLGAAGTLLLAGVFGASWRVAEATAGPAAAGGPAILSAADHPHLGRPAPQLGLADQDGAVLRLADLAGRPALVTFAFGHCTDICAPLVRGARGARDAAARAAATAGKEPRAAEGGADDAPVPLVVVTLDPWRDTPARLPDIARRWELGPGDHLLGGTVEEVEAVLDAWNVGRARDPLTGDVAHPPLVYVLDGDGRIAFATTSGPGVLADLLARVSEPTPPR